MGHVGQQQSYGQKNITTPGKLKHSMQCSIKVLCMVLCENVMYELLMNRYKICWVNKTGC